MIHNLDVFFPAKGHLCSKYAAIVGWLETAAREAVKASVTFAYIRNMMIEGALEYATNPSSKLLSNNLRLIFKIWGKGRYTQNRTNDSSDLQYMHWTIHKFVLQKGVA
jgi:hypothetical protein